MHVTNVMAIHSPITEIHIGNQSLGCYGGGICIVVGTAVS